MSSKNQKAFKVLSFNPTVDWMTITLQRSASREKASQLAHQYLPDALEIGERVSMWSSYGYEGWQIHGLRWGRREQDDLIQVSSDFARDHWREFANLASRCTRLDLAVTVRYDLHNIALISEMYKTIQEIASDLAIVRNYSIITSLFGGDTLYVGRRSSSQMGRVYDKGVESSDPSYANCIRWEVEFKKPISGYVLAEMQASENVEMYIASRVKQWFEDRLVEVAWAGSSKMNAIEISRKKSSDDQAIDWLSKQVAPTVQRLIARKGILTVLKALGIPSEEPSSKEEL